jgi:hypothetical protein
MRLGFGGKPRCELKRSNQASRAGATGARNIERGAVIGGGAYER